MHLHLDQFICMFKETKHVDKLNYLIKIVEALAGQLKCLYIQIKSLT